LDVFTAQYLQSGGADGPRMFYVPRDVLERVGRKYETGALPVSGTTKDGKPFHMDAIVAGEGSVHFLYDLQDFSYMDGKDEVKISNAGDVAYQIKGPADVLIKGFKGCGCLSIFCGCADIQRMTKIPGNKMHVETSSGQQTESLTAVRLN
jgi:hypothetical protein